jgi:predicted DNA-binding transcriptional regulator AlpA
MGKTTAPSFYTVTDIQQILGIGRNSAYKLVAGKGFPAVYVGNRIIVPTDHFEEWICRQTDKRKGRA